MTWALHPDILYGLSSDFDTNEKALWWISEIISDPPMMNIIKFNSVFIMNIIKFLFSPTQRSTRPNKQRNSPNRRG